MNNVLTNIKNNLSKASVNKRLYVFLVCLFFATFYWLINVLGNQYTSDIRVKVEYVNHPAEQVILSDLPTYLTANVSTDGYTLLAYQLKIKKPLVEINFSNYQFEESRNKNEIIVADFKSSLSKQFGEKILLNEISPKKINVELDLKKTKSLRVAPLYKLAFKNQFQLSDSVVIIPDVVEVTGPKSTLDTINFIPTQFIEINNIEGSLTKHIKLDEDYLIKHHLQVKNTTVELSISADKFTEYKLSLPIEVINPKDSVEIEIMPTTIDVKFMIPLSKLSMLKAEEFRVVVDCDDLSAVYKKLKVQIVKYPAFLKSITVKPANVEYVLKRK